MFNILSWNILQGGGSRILKIIDKVKQEQPQVIIFSEFRNGASGNRLRSSLLKIGYKYQLVTDANTGVNSVLLASKIPCNSELYSEIDEEFSANIATLHFDGFSICGMYLPHKKKHKLFNKLIEIAASKTPYIMAGDFNSGLNYIDQEGNSFWYEDEFKNLLNHGYRDAFRYVNGDLKEYSWYSHQGNGYRYDHTLVHESLLPIIKDCQYIHEWRESKLSDHSSMKLTLG